MPKVDLAGVRDALTTAERASLFALADGLRTLENDLRAGRQGEVDRALFNSTFDAIYDAIPRYKQDIDAYTFVECTGGDEGRRVFVRIEAPQLWLRITATWGASAPAVSLQGDVWEDACRRDFALDRHAGKPDVVRARAADGGHVTTPLSFSDCPGVRDMPLSHNLERLLVLFTPVVPELAQIGRRSGVTLGEDHIASANVPPIQLSR